MSRGLKPTPRPGSKNTAVPLILGIIIIVLLVGFFLKDKIPAFNNAEEEEEVKETTQTVIEVPSDKQDVLAQNLNSGALLTFGNQQKGTPVSLFIDPEDLNRDLSFTNGSPSKFMQQIQYGKYFLSLYLTPKSPDREEFVKRVTAVTECRAATDKSMTSIYTMDAVIRAGTQLDKDASIEDIAKVMEADLSACPVTLDENVTKATSNAQYFLHNSFGIDGNTALYANNGVVTNIFNLKTGWEVGIAEGIDPTALVPHDEDTAVVTDVNVETNAGGSEKSSQEK